MTSPDPACTARQPPPARSLVLFVGLGPRPGPELAEGLVRAGVRGLWLERMDQALAAAVHAHFDAAVVRLDESVSLAARRFDAWRQALACPLLLLAESLDEVDEIIALELGADGLLAQPVSARRLRAHLLMLLRRSGGEGHRATPPADPTPRPAAAGWTLDRVHNRLCRADSHGERRVSLTELQAALLQVLLTDLGRVVPRSRLLAAASPRRTLQPRSVDVYVARLRQRLLEDQVDDLQLEGVRGRGYMLTLAPQGGVPWATSAPALGWAAPAVALQGAVSIGR